MSTEGYIKIYRAFFDHWLWADDTEPRCRGGAWIDMIRMAAFKDTKHMIGSSIIPVPRGSFFASERFLAQRWRWSQKKVRGFLTLLVEEQMVGIQRNQQGSIITLSNYDSYNAATAIKESLRNHSGITQESPRNQIIERKEEKEGKELTHTPAAPAHGEPLVTLDQAKAYAPQAGVTAEVAEQWWLSRDARGWLEKNSDRPITRWQSDLKSFSIAHQEIAASRQPHSSHPSQSKRRELWQIEKDIAQLTKQRDLLTNTESSYTWQEVISDPELYRELKAEGASATALDRLKSKQKTLKPDIESKIAALNQKITQLKNEITS